MVIILHPLRNRITRKVPHGFRSDWGRDLFAAVRSVVNTGKRQGLSAFEAIRNGSPGYWVISETYKSLGKGFSL